MSVVIKGFVEWAQLEQVNDMSGKYQVDLCGLSDKAVAALEAMELTVQYKEDNEKKGHYITCKSSRPIRVYDTDDAVIDGRVVGNGSEFVAKVGSFEWTFKKKSGVSPNLQRLTITELEIYEADEDDDSPVDLDEAL